MMPIINIHPLPSEEKAESFRLTLKDADKFGLYCCSDGKSELWSVIPKIALDLIFNVETALPVTERPWVGLTDEEVNTIYEQAEVLVHDSWVGNGTVGLMFPITLYKMFEAKLKEKNT